MKVLRIAAVIVVVITVGWMAFVGVNVGGLLSRVLGKAKPKKEATVTDSSKNTVGTITHIQEDRNPLRDKSVVKTSRGDIKLPKGVKDTDVRRVTKVGTEYEVEVKHEKLTAVFDD